MSDEDIESQQWGSVTFIGLEQVSAARRNHYFYEHRPYEHFNRSLALLRLLTVKGRETYALVRTLDESWIVDGARVPHGEAISGTDDLDAPHVILQALTLKFQAIETLLRYLLAHYDSPSEPWSHISQLRVPRDFSERVRRLRSMGRAGRLPVVEQVFFGGTETEERKSPWSQTEREQQLVGVDTFLELCLSCWLDDQGPFLAIKHGYVAIPHEVTTRASEEATAQEHAWSSWTFRYITRDGRASDWEFRAVRPGEPNVVACEIFFASRLRQQLLDVGRIRNVPSEARTIEVIWWDDALCERVRNGTLDITDGPPPTRPWTVPH